MFGMRGTAVFKAMALIVGLVLWAAGCGGGGGSNTFSSSPAPSATVNNTSTGTNVSVQPADTTGGSPVKLTFNTVIQGGVTSLSISSTGLAPPAGFLLGSPAQYYDLATTAVFSGAVSVCINYGTIAFVNSPRLFHYNGTAWVDVTTSVDPTNRTVCGNVTSLSPFAIFQAAAVPAIFSPNATTFTVGMPGSFTVTATGFPIPSLTEAGALPNGVTFTDNHDGTAKLSGTPTDAGNFQITIIARNGTTLDTVQSFTLMVAPAMPTITWANPANITYGTPLSSAQLNAIASVPGTFTYTPAAGTVLSAGNQTLSVKFTPTDTNYQSVSRSVSVNVTPATLTVTAQNAARAYGAANPVFSAIISGFVNEDTQSVVSGSANLTTTAMPASNVGSFAITVTAGTLAAANYTFSFVNGTLTVNAAVLTVTAQNASRAYGVANPNFTASITGFVNGDTQSSVSGTPTLATTATMSSNVGTYPITASQGTLTALNYTCTFVGGTLTITPATPTLMWNNPAALTYGTALSATQLNATASVPGSFAYTPPAGTVLNAGTSQTLSVAFTPNDTINYTTKTATVTITVLQAMSTVTWNNPAAITYGTALSATQLNATASVPGSFAYTPPAGTVLNASANQALSVTFTPTDTTSYTTKTATVTITVLQATPAISWNNPAAITYGTALSGTQLNASANVPGSFAYTPPAGTVLNAGANQTLSATFFPTDATNYSTQTTTASITITKANASVTVNGYSGVFDGAAHGASGTAKGVQNEDLSSLLNLGASFTNVPGGTAHWTFAGNNNYSANAGNANIAISKATASVTPNAASKTYGTADPALTGTLAGFLAADNVTATRIHAVRERRLQAVPTPSARC